MNQEAAFIQAIREEPDDEAHVLIFADWLEEQDDPRGQWIRDRRIRPWMGDDFEDPRPAIIAALEKNKKVREVRAACEALGPDIVPELIETLGHVNGLVRRYTALCLWKIGPAAKEAVPALLEALTDSSRPVREDVAKALLAIGPQPDLDTTKLRAALTDESYQVRDKVQKLLAKAESKESVVETLAERLDDPNASVREEVLRSLATMREVGIPTLCKALSDRAASVREEAAAQLSYLCTPKSSEAVEPLRQALKIRRPSFDFLHSVLGAASRIGPNARPLAGDILPLTQHEDSWIRGGALYTLGAIRSEEPAVMSAFVDALEDADEDVQATALIALGKGPRIPQRHTPAILRGWMRLRAGDYQRAEALSALGRLEHPSEEAVAVLRTALNSSNEYLAYQAAMAISGFGEEASEFLPELVDLMRRTPNMEAVASAVVNLGEAGLVEMGKLLRGASFDLQRGIADALKDLDPKRGTFILPYLREHFRSDYTTYHTRYFAEFVGRMGDDGSDALPELIGLLGRDFRIHPTIVKTVESFGEALVPHIDQFEKLLDPKAIDWYVPSVCRILGTVAKYSTDVSKPLLAQLELAQRTDGPNSHHIAKLREVLPKAFANLGPDASEAVQLLLPLLTDQNKNVRRDTCIALGKIGSDEANDGLRRVCRDADESVRVRAVGALGLIGSASTAIIDAVVLAIEDAKPRVRREAVTALARLGDTRVSVLNALRTRESDSDAKVRTLVQRAMKKLTTE